MPTTRLLATRRPDGLLVPVAIRGDDGLLRPAGEGCKGRCCGPCDFWFIAEECDQSVPGSGLCAAVQPGVWAIRCDHPTVDGGALALGDVVRIAGARCATLITQAPEPTPFATPLDPEGPPLERPGEGCDDFTCQGPPQAWIRGEQCDPASPDVWVCPQLVGACGVYDIPTDIEGRIQVRCYKLNPAAVVYEQPPAGALVVTRPCDGPGDLDCIGARSETCCECGCPSTDLLNPCDEDEVLGHVCCELPDDQEHSFTMRFESVSEQCSGTGCGGNVARVISRDRNIQTMVGSGHSNTNGTMTITTRTIHTDLCDDANSTDETDIQETQWFVPRMCPVRPASSIGWFSVCPDEHCSATVRRTATSFFHSWECNYPPPVPCANDGQPGGLGYTVFSSGSISYSVDHVDNGDAPCSNEGCGGGDGPLLNGRVRMRRTRTMDLGSGLGRFL